MTAALATFPFGAEADAGPDVVPVPAALPGAALIDDCYVLQIDAFAGDGATPPAIVPDTLGTYAFGTDPTPFAAGAVTAIAFSDRGYTTAPGDDPANTHFEARLKVPLTIARTIPLTPEAGTRAASQLGLIEIDNADGAQDGTGDLAVDARPVVVKRGLVAGPWGDFETLFVGAGVKWDRSTASLRLLVRGRDYLFDQPLQPNLYGGTGGGDGGAELKGKPKPLVFGLCRDVPAIAVSSAALIYQAHDGAVKAIDQVYDRAQALDFAADYASYVALAAATIAPGEYATCIAGGYFRLGGTPVGTVTADIRGDAAPSLGGYTANAAQIARRLMLSRGGQNTGDLDEPGIAATGFDVPGISGHFFADPVTVAEALDRVCAGAFLWWGALRSGVFTIRRMKPPGNPRYAIGVTDIVGDVELQGLPDSVDPCNWRRRVNFRRCWSPQSGTEIDNASLDAGRRDFVREAFRTTTVADPARTVRNLLAADPPPLDSAFDNEHDAAALAQNLLDLFAPGRRLYRVPIGTKGHDIDIDETTRVTWPRHGMAAGKDLRVIGMDERHDRRGVDLLVFG